MPSGQDVREFRQIVWDYFGTHGRSMPWRDHPTPYAVLVSELMLQQTQVGRVLPKFEVFLKRFPAVETLAEASLADVLGAWSGLGYNRRAKFLHAAAQQIADKHSGKVPSTHRQLVDLPGIGPNTAGAILAYAFEQPVVFVETNIRTVYFHHFFADHDKVADSELLPIVEQTLDIKHPREWYWALMDYGTHLKKTQGGNISQSKHYTRQSVFLGSRRQLRGRVIRELLGGAKEFVDLKQAIDDERLDSVLGDLVSEAFVTIRSGQVQLTGSPSMP